MFRVIHLVFNDPGVLTIYLTLYLIAVSSLLGIIFLLVASRKRRITPVYLGGEPENVINTPTPSPMNLYWGFIKRFAKSLYVEIRDKTHTGNLQDWIKLMASWYGFLLLVSLVLGIIYVIWR